MHEDFRAEEEQVKLIEKYNSASDGVTGAAVPGAVVEIAATTVGIKLPYDVCVPDCATEPHLTVHAGTEVKGGIHGTF